MSDHPINSNRTVPLRDSYQPPQPPTASTLTLTYQLVTVSQSPLVLTPPLPATPACLPVAISAPAPALRANNLPGLPLPDVLSQPNRLHTAFARYRTPAAMLPLPFQPDPPPLSEYAKSLQAIINADPSGELRQQADESTDNWAVRLKKDFPELSVNDASAVTRASLWGLERRKAFKKLPFSPLARQVLAELRRSPPGPNKSPLKLAGELRTRYPALTKDEVVFLTGANPVSLQNLPAFKTKPLSADGEKALALQQQHPARFPDKASAVDRARDWQLLAAENGLHLSRGDLMQLADISAPLLCKHPELLNPPLSSHGEFVKQQIAAKHPRFIQKQAQTAAERAADLLRLAPELGTIDLVLLTGVKYNTAALLRALQRKPLTSAGEMLKQRVESPHWNPYQPVIGEYTLDWGIRVSNMDYRLTAEDVAKINFCSVYSLRKRLRRRSKLSSTAIRVMAKLNSPHPGELARRQGEDWDLWFDRLQKKEPRLTENELFLLTGFTPDIQLNYPANISASAAAPPAATTPDLVQLLTSPAPATAFASTASSVTADKPQSVTLAVQDEILRAKGLRRVRNNGHTGTAYRNCLLIAVLQHATGDYTQSDALCQLVNHYRQLLIHQGWLEHASGFGPDGYMAFGQQGEQAQGAAAALLGAINSNLIKGGLAPLRVINYSFAAGIEFEEILGSPATDARVVHTVNTGEHFEALIHTSEARQG